MSAKFTWTGGSADVPIGVIRNGVVDGMVGVALILQKNLRTYLSQPGSGRRYRVAKGKRRGRNARARGWHVASAPGKPPAALNGSLRASWTIAPPSRIGGATTQDQGFAYIEETRGKSILYTLGSNLVYARALEYGFGRVAQRPYVRPIVKATEPRVPEIMSKMMQRRLRTMK